MNNNRSDGRWWVTFPTCRERENNDDEPNYEDILRCLDRWTKDGLGDRDILDEWTNGERGDTTFPTLGQCKIYSRWPICPLKHDDEIDGLTFTWNHDITFLLLGEEAARKGGRTVDPTFFFFPYFRRRKRQCRKRQVVGAFPFDFSFTLGLIHVGIKVS